MVDDQEQNISPEEALITWERISRINRELLEKELPPETELVVVVHPGFAKYYPRQWANVSSSNLYQIYQKRRKSFIDESLAAGKKLMIMAPVGYLSETLKEVPDYNSAIILPTFAESTYPQENMMDITVDEFLEILQARLRKAIFVGEWAKTCIHDVNALFSSRNIPTEITDIVI